MAKMHRAFLFTASASLIILQFLLLCIMCVFFIFSIGSKPEDSNSTSPFFFFVILTFFSPMGLYAACIIQANILSMDKPAPWSYLLLRNLLLFYGIGGLSVIIWQAFSLIAFLSKH